MKPKGCFCRVSEKKHCSCAGAESRAEMLMQSLTWIGSRCVFAGESRLRADEKCWRRSCDVLYEIALRDFAWQTSFLEPRGTIPAGFFFGVEVQRVG